MGLRRRIDTGRGEGRRKFKKRGNGEGGGGTIGGCVTMFAVKEINMNGFSQL